MGLSWGNQEETGKTALAGLGRQAVWGKRERAMIAMHPQRSRRCGRLRRPFRKASTRIDKCRPLREPSLRRDRGPIRSAAPATIPAVLDVLLVTFPFFALVLCGYAAAARGMLPLSAIAGLNSFVLFFALPALLYRFGASTPIARLVNPAVAGVWLVCSVLLVLSVVAMNRDGRTDWNNAAFGALVAAFSNTGFMGVPLLVALFGERAAGTAIITIVVDLLFTSSLCIALSRLDAPGGAAQAAKNALRGVFFNPLPWAVLAGGLASALEFELWAPLQRTVGLLADAASPAALFTIGAMLARTRMLAAQHEKQRLQVHDAPTTTAPLHARPRLADVLRIVGVKLLVHPLLVLCLGTVAIQAGAPLPAFALTIMVLVAALPSASNVAVLAERFDADTGRLARIILLSTAAAFLTFSGAVVLMR